MKRLSAFALVSAALALAPVALLAEPDAPSGRQPRIVSRPAAPGQPRPAQIVPKSVSLTGYSVQLNIVTRVQGLSFYRTAVDVTNNTSTPGVTATFQYCYTLNGSYRGCTMGQTLVLQGFDSFHTDDIIQYLGTFPGLLPADAIASSFGTFIVSFDSLPTNHGWEGTVTGRTYSPINQAQPLAGTVAIAYPGSLFFESATGSLVAIARNTRFNPTEAGALRTNLGVTNTALFNTTQGATVDFQVVFYDTATGAVVGDALIPPHPLEAGEVYQFNDVWSAAHIPNTVESCIVFVDVTSVQGANPDTIEAYVDTLDGGTNDGAYFEFKCSVGCPSGTF
jgi:hypothetical protein